MCDLLLAYAFYVIATRPGLSGQGDSGWWPTMPFAEYSALWTVIGFCGIATFGTRFLLQWVHSEKVGESRVPPSFWYQSLVGTIILTFYFTWQRDIVGLSGYIINVVPYTRNIMLIHRKKRRDAANGFPVVPAPEAEQKQTP